MILSLPPATLELGASASEAGTEMSRRTRSRTALTTVAALVAIALALRLCGGETRLG